MKRGLVWLALALAALLVAASAFAGRANAAGTTLHVSRVGTTTMPAGTTVAPVASGGLIEEFANVDVADSDANGSGGDDDQGTDRTFPGATTHAVPNGKGAAKAKSNPELGAHWQGLDFFDQRFANGGNQFSVEPPDQSLCAGDGYVVEAVNDVIRVYGTDGTPKSGVVDLNTFYGYPAAINRATGVRGPNITDPVCYFDPQAHRFVQIVLTLDETPTGLTTGRNHFDIAVSNTADPTKTWTIYTIPTQNDGTEGTPNHHCPPGAIRPTKTNPNACLADYPHVGADRNGVYITSNEFPFFPAGFIGADIYAIGKAELYSGASTLDVWEQSTGLGPVNGPDGAGFTVWPATSPGDQYADDANGTEYFLSSRAVFSDDGTADSILVWALTNTASLNTATPSPNLSVATVPSQEYAVPPKASQKSGPTPLRDCINSPTTLVTTAGGVLPCVVALGGNPAFVPTGGEVISKLDAIDSRFTGVAYANGKLWGTLGTGVDPGTGPEAAAAWFILKPTIGAGGVSASMALDGILAGDNVNYTFPSVAVTQSGRGVIPFTVVGPNDYPSAGYATIDAKVGAGPAHVIAAGAGPQDGFSGYQAFRQTLRTARPRWGDYGAAVVDGKNIWIASEYIAQSCTLADYLTANPSTLNPSFGTCGNTRGPLGNWSTHISQLTP